MKFSELIGLPVARDFEVRGVAEDSRKVAKGDVFVWDSRVAPSTGCRQAGGRGHGQGSGGRGERRGGGRWRAGGGCGAVLAKHAAAAWPQPAAP